MSKEQILLPTDIYQTFSIVRKGATNMLTSSDIEEIVCYLMDVDTGEKAAEYSLSGGDIALVAGSTTVWAFWVKSAEFEIGKTYKITYTVTTKVVVDTDDLEDISGYFDREIYIVGNAEPAEPAE